MQNAKIHNDNLCSIKGIKNTFLGNSFVKDILNTTLMQTSLVVANIQRPYHESNDIFNMLNEFENLKIDEDWFSISFKYKVKNKNDNFIRAFLETWFVYEQPSFTFFVAGQDFGSYENLNISRRMNWKEIIEISNCFIFFKGVEEDVIWIGKSTNLQFDEILSQN